ncbi:SPASM domain-containing protein [Hamadaea sp. NPDC050747]|uniref:SPASM domain-containing protein n=1 Tax=Hamadaea sp. NPDC050747 TaxID=3155789 RepID=UPI0033D313D7
MDDRYPATPPLPSSLQVEITSACNLRCAMCLVSYRAPVNKLAGAMGPDLFEPLVDSLPELDTLTLQGLGEPLLSPYLLRHIGYAKERGVRAGFNSNATLLTRGRAEELVGSGVDWLHVSLDGARAETFEGIRAGADFDRVVGNLSGLVEAKRSADSPSPWIRVVFVAMRRNVGELAALVQLLGEVGVDEVRVQNLSHSFSDTDPSGQYAGIRDFAAAEALWTGADSDRVGEAFAEARDAARDNGVRLRLPGLTPAPSRDPDRPGCTWPWDSAYVTSAGVVQPCCMVMGDDRVHLGDLTEQTFPEIWHGEAYQEFRRQLTTEEPPEVCRGCSLYQSTF